MTTAIPSLSDFEYGTTPQLQKRLLTPLLLKKVPPIPTTEERPLHQQWRNPLSFFLFTWLYPLLHVGYKRTLVEEDMLKLNDEMTAERLAAKFRAIFERRVENDKKKHLYRKAKLRGETIDTSSVAPEKDMDDYRLAKSLCFLSLIETFSVQYPLAITFAALSLSGSACTPLLSRKLISFVLKKAYGLDVNMGTGVGYAIGVAALILVTDILLTQATYLARLTGAQIRAIFTTLLLEKSFKLSAKSRKKFTASKLTAIMSTDVSRVDMGTGISVKLFPVVCPVAIAIGILVYNIKAPAMVGIGLMIAFMFIGGVLSAFLFKFRVAAQKSTDARVSYVKELLNNLKMIKFYSWEVPYFNLISKIRRREMSFILKMEFIRMIVITLATSLTLVSAMASFLTLYAIAPASSRNPATIFSSVALFNMLASQFVIIPLALAGSVDAFLGMNRVAEVLAAEELDPNDSVHLITEKDKISMDDEKLSIALHDCDFEWETFDVEEEKDVDLTKDIEQLKKEKADLKKKKKEMKKAKKALKSPTPDSEEKSLELSSFKLNNIDFNVKQGEFVVITGSIGSGKSSLLHAIDGTMKKNSGKLLLNGSLLLCGAPWIQNCTLKENILFGLPFDETWYNKVVKACSLSSDFDILPAGDRTEIGERGITLSGGQKARVCLARAVYAKSDIILLDDVLSAVDAKVGKHIMNECILGLLKDKTRVLATHQLSLISEADSVIFLNGDGSITKGNLAELKSKSPAFSALMDHSQKDEEIEEEEAVEEERNEKDFIEKQLTRHTTTHTIEVNDDSIKEFSDGKLIQEEHKSVNAIGWDVYGRFLLTGLDGFKGNWLLYVVIMMVVFATFTSLFTNNWLSFWISLKFDRSNGFYIGLYVMFTLLAIVFVASQFCGIIYVLNRASRILNIKALKGIIHVPMSYMDTTPMGRVINRFTKDTDVLDNELGDQIAMLIYMFANIVGVVILCIIYMPWFAIAVPFIVAAFIVVATFYQASAREVKRLEAVQRSHIYNNFNEALTGMPTIKSFGLVPRFLKTNSSTIDKTSEAYFITLAAQAWLDDHLAILASCFALLISFLCVFRVFDINASSVGLLLSYVMQISNQISMFVVIFTKVEQDLNSAERILEYAYKLPQEKAYEISETTPPPEWPDKGAIEFNNIGFAYREGLPLTLKKFNAQIRPHEKIGICGRTGAGKSSIMVALFRIAELSHGSIVIDGIDTATLGLHALRSKLSIIPQDPVLFKGTIRKNLDPFGTKTDDELWNTLTRADIIPEDKLEKVKSQKPDDEDFSKFHLDGEVEDDGENFSLGERQLVAFARALVRNSKILVLDEATSSVDYATDSKLQKAIAREFSDCTILCIAHRLKTIVNYDRVMVLDQGAISEFDTPSNLFHSEGSIFRQMCDNSGITLHDFGTGDQH